MAAEKAICQQKGRGVRGGGKC